MNPYNGSLIECKVLYFPPSSSSSASANEPTAGGAGGHAQIEALESKGAVMTSKAMRDNAGGGGGGADKKADGVTLRMLVLDAPSATNLGAYVAALQASGVKHLVRVCQQRYRADMVESANVRCHAWPFEDGRAPPQPVIDQWLGLLDSEIRGCAPNGQCPLIAIHCVAGLGRAPIMVAIALVEYGLMAPMDAVGYVRARRPGAINTVQLDWLMKYTPRREKDGIFGKVFHCCPVQ